ncbi:LacI family DNA-binding transcriptional regulator [Herbiconiux sp. KACC 21604]|uniref:LacI family DNA-binding transcriptional regulator n=1 Tax=unclassified Herbiconiux TaxID=2618217 RepID=UPI001490EEE0|nr:LacI family DNA-binding transcriptional regulator [Herbiconiux sp. SALV-R1]QJU55568.1 LacI family DNA-binding transcriptional regulator [Herbiconiux sp. SALV-R1]WPO86759.1 LacI family DNA-binding transcriptional regulator [Herbiconiux sp. KACC 21604]
MKNAGGVPTLEMVAAVAGVSRATVSRVVNGSTSVAPEAAAAVHAAVAQLNYVPNRVARSLASRRTDVIALIVPESTSTVFADPFFAPVVRGVARALSDTDYTLNLLIASEARPEKTRRYLLGGNVDGALVVSHHAEDHSYVGLGDSLPIVFGGRPVNPELADAHYVDVDNQASARLATGHLVDIGRRRIAHIAGRQDMPAGIDRLAGWRAVVGGDAARTDELVEFGDFTQESGVLAMRRLLDRASDTAGAPAFDAVFVANDQMAAGAMRVLHERGLSVPGDVAVVGYDDDTFASTLTPPLTTVHQPSADLGARMAEVLVARLAGKNPPHRTLIPTHLVVRAST